MKTIANNISRKVMQLQEAACTLSGDICEPLIISKEHQQKELKTLSRLVVHEHFFFVTDLKTYTVVNSDGIAKWLGYSENEFSMFDYFKIIHPSMLDATMLKMLIVYELTCTGKMRTDCMESKFVIQHALRHANGSYIWVKLISTPFQMNNKAQVTEYLNNFTIIGPYNNERASTRFADIDGRYDAMILPVMRERAKDTLPFSEQEYNIIRMMANDPLMQADDIAARLSIEKSTLNTYKKRILFKARDYTKLSFREATEVAVFFKQQGML